MMSLYFEIKKLLQSNNKMDVMLGEELSKKPENFTILEEEIRSKLSAPDKSKFDDYLRRYPGNKILSIWPKFYSDFIKR